MGLLDSLLGAVTGGAQNSAGGGLGGLIGMVANNPQVLQSITGLLGNETDARRVIEALERTNRLLAQTETQLYGPQGLADEARRTAGELRAVLGEARTNLEKLDRILADVGRIASNARGASEDLDLLRAEVEASLRRVSGLVEEVNRKWPFARERELKLP